MELHYAIITVCQGWEDYFTFDKWGFLKVILFFTSFTVAQLLWEFDKFWLTKQIRIPVKANDLSFLKQIP